MLEVAEQLLVRVRRTISRGKTMNMPGFTAEVTLHTTSSNGYIAFMPHSHLAGQTGVLPQAPCPFVCVWIAHLRVVAGCAIMIAPEEQELSTGRYCTSSAEGVVIGSVACFGERSPRALGLGGCRFLLCPDVLVQHTQRQPLRHEREWRSASPARRMHLLHTSSVVHHRKPRQPACLKRTAMLFSINPSTFLYPDRDSDGRYA